YFGSLALALGFGIMSANWAAAALLVIPSLIVYPVVIRREEAHLARLFPQEFALYRSKVPRFIPRFGRIEQSFSLRQYVANREYNTALGFVGALGVFILKWRFIGS